MNAWVLRERVSGNGDICDYRKISHKPELNFSANTPAAASGKWDGTTCSSSIIHITSWSRTSWLSPFPPFTTKKGWWEVTGNKGTGHRTAHNKPYKHNKPSHLPHKDWIPGLWRGDRMDEDDNPKQQGRGNKITAWPSHSPFSHKRKDDSLGVARYWRWGRAGTHNRRHSFIRTEKKIVVRGIRDNNSLHRHCRLD